MTRKDKTVALCLIVEIGLLLAIVFHGFMGVVLGLPYPADTFLYEPDLRFSDFYWIFDAVKSGSPLSGQWSLYLPFAYVPLYPLVGFDWPVAYAIVGTLFCASLVWFFWRQLDFLSGTERWLASVILPLLSYGTLFSIDRGNIDQLVVLFTLTFFVLFARGRALASAIPLAAAIAMKAYPGALGVLLLVRRQYAAAALTGVLTVALTLGALALYPGGFWESLDLWRDRAGVLQHDYVANPKTHAYSLSYLSLLKVALRVAHVDFTAHADLILRAYAIGAGALFLGVAAYVAFVERTQWKQVYLLVFVLIVLPQVSFDYKLIFLLLPVALFLRAETEGRRLDWIHIALFGSLLIPKGYLPLASDTKMAVLLNPLALTVLAGVIVWTGSRARAGATSTAGPASATAADRG